MMVGLLEGLEEQPGVDAALAVLKPLAEVAQTRRLDRGEQATVSMVVTAVESALS